MIPKMTNPKILIAFLVVAVFAVFASSASAECGPGFTNKKQLIHYYQNNPDAAHGFREELLAHPATGYQADETVVNWLRSPEQRVFNAPSGYHLTSNTYCPGGPGHYAPYNGLLDNMGGRPMLWHCDKDGKCIPILKGYCMNFVCGPPVHKHPKKCKCRKPKKPKCKCHHKKHPKPKCSTKSPGGGGGNCNTQVVTVTPKQECEANNHSGTNCQQVTVTVVANCSNVSMENSGNVNQGGNCNNGGTETCVGQSNCNTETPPPPCGCKPEEPEVPKKPEQPVVEWKRIQEVHLKESTELCVTVTPTSVVGEVQFAVVDGKRSNGGKGVYNAGTNKYCVIYTAPTEEPAHVCQEEWISAKLPPGTKCDVAHVAVFCNNGAETVKGSMEIPVTDAEGKGEIVW